jgi:3-hydroxyacyl-CoA dehydrogenase
MGRASDECCFGDQAHVCNSLYEEFKRDEYAPPPLRKRMVASGRLGRTSGRGFYEYA